MKRLLRWKHLIRVGLALTLCTGMVILSMAVPVPTAQGPKDPAELLPTSTPFYLEFSQPQPIVQELSALLKGSSLDDMPAFLTEFRDKFGDEMPYWATQSYSMLGTFLGPEGLAEAGRLKAGCVALTGFDKNHTPEFLWVLMSGESNAPGFVMRAILTENRNMRSSEKVSGVALYQELNWRTQFKDRIFKDKDGPPVREQPEPKYSGPTYALMPGMLLIGSNSATVRDAVLRARGTKAEPSLAQSAGFQKSAKLRERPGVFAYADLGLLSAQAENFLKDAPPEARSEFASFWKGAKALTNPKGLRTVAASLTLQKSGLDLQAQLLFDPNQEVPLLALLPEKAVQPDMLHFAPGNSLAALTFSVSDGAKRWEQLVGLADTVFRESGEEGEAPSKLIEGLQDKLKIHFGKDVLDKVASIGLVMGTWAEPGHSGQLLVVKTANLEAAKSLESALLEAVRLIDDDKTLLPTSHEIEEQAIRSFPAAGRRPAIHQGRQGSTLVLGLHPRQVADALVAGSKKQGLLAQPRLAESLKALDEPLVVGVGSLNRTVLTAMKAMTASEVGELGQPDFSRKQNREAMEKLLKVLAQSSEEMSPAVLSLSRKPGVLTLTLHQTGLQAVSAQTVDAVMEWNLRRSIGEGFPFRKEMIAKEKDRPFRDKERTVKEKDRTMPKDRPIFKDKELGPAKDKDLPPAKDDKPKDTDVFKDKDKK
jgi:Protein of unknown function (DUF3352)